ncbi:unnamed protein product [Rhizophagus irregularis]|nr:unnamed protein product [Rhizophagus irregularis]
MDTDIPGNRLQCERRYFRDIGSRNPKGFSFRLLGFGYILGFGFRFLGVGYVGFSFRFLGVEYVGFSLGFGYMDEFRLGLWIYGFRLGLWIYGFLPVLGFRLPVLGLWVSTSDFWFDFPLRTLLDGHVSPSDFIRLGFLQTFIMLGEDDG